MLSRTLKGRAFSQRCLLRQYLAGLQSSVDTPVKSGLQTPVPNQSSTASFSTEALPFTAHRSHVDELVSQVLVSCREKNDHGNRQALLLAQKLLAANENELSSSHYTFHKILNTLLNINQVYNHRLKKLQQKAQQNEFSKHGEGNPKLNVQLANSLGITKGLRLQLMKLAREWFSRFLAQKSANFQDYMLMLKLETSNNNLHNAQALVREMESIFDTKNITSTTFWNLKLKALCDSMPRFWQAEPSVPGLKKIDIGRMKWAGEHPSKIRSYSVILEPLQMVESGKLQLDLPLATRIILGLGRTGGIDLLKLFVSDTWGIDLVNGSESRIPDGHELYPDVNLMKAILTAFGVNGNISEGIEVCSEFTKIYSIGENDSVSFWGLLYKWTDLNTKVPSSKDVKELLTRKGKDTLAETIESERASLISRNTEMCDAVFNCTVASNPSKTFPYPLLLTRFRHLRKFQRLERLLAELPIFYTLCVGEHSDDRFADLHFTYLQTILNIAMQGEIRDVESKIKDRNAPSNEIVKINRRISEEYQTNGGPFFVFKDSYSKKEEFLQEVQRTYKSRNYRLVEKDANDVSQEMERLFASQKQQPVNVELVKTLMFYRMSDPAKIQQLKKDVVRNVKNLMTQRQVLTEKYFAEQDDEDGFFGVF